MNHPVIPDGEGYFLPGGAIGCILLHGFTAMPAETRPLGDYLHEKGCTVLGVRLSGHGTHPEDLAGVQWMDWLDDVQAGVNHLQESVENIYIIGQSMGGMIGLVAATQLAVTGVIALSTPAFIQFSQLERNRIQRNAVSGRMIRKKGVRVHRTYGICRERSYPAYAAYPARILLELEQLCSAMREGLPRVRVPALLVQSRQDQGISLDSLPYLYEQIGSAEKRMVWLEGMDHSLIQDPGRQVMMDLVWDFISGRIT